MTPPHAGLRGRGDPAAAVRAGPSAAVGQGRGRVAGDDRAAGALGAGVVMVLDRDRHMVAGLGADADRRRPRAGRRDAPEAGAALRHRRWSRPRRRPPRRAIPTLSPTGRNPRSGPATPRPGPSAHPSAPHGRRGRRAAAPRPLPSLFPSTLPRSPSLPTGFPTLFPPWPGTPPPPAHGPAPAPAPAEQRLLREHLSHARRRRRCGAHGERRSRHTRRGSITTWRSGPSSPRWPRT